MASTVERSVCTGSDSILRAKSSTNSASESPAMSSFLAVAAASSSSVVSSPMSSPASCAASSASSSAKVLLICSASASISGLTIFGVAMFSVVVCASSAMMPTGSSGAVRLIFSVAIVKSLYGFTLIHRVERCVIRANIRIIHQKSNSLLYLF